MKITVKTVQQQTYLFDVEPTETIGQLKEKIRTESQNEVAWQKLIFSGKVLEDNSKIESLGIKENDFLVLMVRKPKASETSSAPSVAPSTPSSVAPPSSSPLPTPPAVKDPQVAQSLASSSPSVTSTPVSTAPPAVQQPSSSPAATDSSLSSGTGLVTGSEYEQTVSSLCEMGFSREEVVKALRVAFNNPERAVEYLFNGIPEVAETPAANPSVASPASTPETTSAGQPAQPSSEGSGVFDFLRQHPQFAMLRTMVQQNPSLLQPVLQQLGQQNPELLGLINTHQQEFIQLLNSPGPATGASSPSGAPQGVPPGANYVQVTPEEKAAIDRLSTLGFDRTAVIEAFFACDKDETLAANYLLENAGDIYEDEMPE
eukprot:TRINITY_DN612_c0_g1_i1.p1 TRINITY_DN612_c0_g1~~TRINITY_DN612_c0_g1_i1.p1  ORF type:complete len:373 (+),score=110.39 TRINITY_DN612_c0_g1_i1:153-1271(+)